MQGDNMQLNLKLFISTLALLLSMGSAFGLQTPATGTQKAGKAVAERESTKYRRFFFPHGLPLRENDYTDRQERPSYKFYSDLQVPNTQLVVAAPPGPKTKCPRYGPKMLMVTESLTLLFRLLKTGNKKARAALQHMSRPCTSFRMTNMCRWVPLVRMSSHKSSKPASHCQK